jgi:hypothetical protein
MSAAEVAQGWHKEQSNRVGAYKPKKPEMPNDNRCAQGDTVCTDRIPSPPSGSVNEPFRSASTDYPLEWIGVMVAASIVFLLLTRR